MSKLAALLAIIGSGMLGHPRPKFTTNHPETPPQKRPGAKSMRRAAHKSRKKSKR